MRMMAAEGKLTMAEVQSLELPKAKLVVLSECDSFKGELRRCPTMTKSSRLL